MNLLEEAKKGNRVIRLEFPDGKRIPFRLLTWESYTRYWEALLKGTILPAVLEREIFKECVLEYDYVENINSLRAGIVPTVALTIMQLSGPCDISLFNPSLDICRKQVDTINSQIVMVICRAFPAYKPEDVEQMPWGKVLFRLAQAERILMSKNPPELLEPIGVATHEDVKKKGKKSGKLDINDLIKEGHEMSRQVDGPPPKQKLDLTPEQIAKVEQLARRRKNS